MLRNLKVTDRVGDTVVVGSEGALYSSCSTDAVDAVIVEAMFNAVSARIVPWWARSLASSRSFGRGKDLREDGFGGAW